MKNVSYIAGDCLKPETFEKELEDVDAVIHSVGALFDSKTYEKSFRALNRDSAINMARCLQ